MKQVLFLCTANYYRSRFAGHLFNGLALEAHLEWRADSRGLEAENWSNIGPISRYAAGGLTLRGVPINGDHRLPKQVVLADLANADLVVAVKQAEDRAMIAAEFPLWTDIVEYWHIDDLDCAGPEEALPLLEEQVRGLVTRLQGL